MAKPVRLSLSRRKGFNLQENSRAANGLAAKTVARPGCWGNPFVIGRDGTQAECVARYRDWLALPAIGFPLEKTGKSPIFTMHKVGFLMTPVAECEALGIAWTETPLATVSAPRAAGCGAEMNS